MFGGALHRMNEQRKGHFHMTVRELQDQFRKVGVLKNGGLCRLSGHNALVRPQPSPT